MASATDLRPVPLELKKSFGFGDRLGLAGPGHIRSAKKYDFAGIFAQQSIRELERTRRTGEEVMDAACAALADAGWSAPWGADADHLKSPADIERMHAAGYTFFTIDPSEFVNNAADTMNASDLAETVATQEADGIYGGETVSALYLDKTFPAGDGPALAFSREELLRAAVKYGRATSQCAIMARAMADICGRDPYEIEVSVDETESPTSPLEHLFFALELKRHGVSVVSLAPRFIGDMEKGIDYKGDLQAFEAALEQHVAIAKAYGPYKISVHSGSDKFSIYPICGRVCGDLIHVKTAGTSYLEALRAVLRVDQALFDEIVAYSAGRFSTDKATYHISVTDEWVANLSVDAGTDREQVFLQEDFGRQMLHVTFGSVLTMGKTNAGRPFGDAIRELLTTHADVYAEVLETHFDKHLGALNAG